MQTEQRDSNLKSLEEKRKAALELCFITLVGLAVMAGFFAALTYDFISARVPLFVMVPLLLLIFVQINRTRRQTRGRNVLAELSLAFSGQNSEFNAVAGFVGLMVLLLLLIYVAGHYVGISVFMLTLLRLISKESWALSLTITVVVTALIYMLFEHGFNIELYRGYVFRMLSLYELIGTG